MSESRLLLDTCALIWLVMSSDDLGPRARDAIEHASIVYVSAITAWEVSLKAARGALRLPSEPAAWFSLAIEQQQLTLAPLDVDILIAANALPWYHRDPADRFMIATAQKLGASVVTTDRLFDKYDVTVVC